MKVYLTALTFLFLSFCLEADVEVPSISRFTHDIDIMDVALSKDTSTVAFVWKERDAVDSEIESLRLQFFDPDGVATSDVILVSESTSIEVAKIVFNRDGNLLLAYNFGSEKSLKVVLYSLSGIIVLSPFILESENTGNALWGILEGIELNSDDSFNVNYSFPNGVGQSSHFAIYARTLNSSGSKIGEDTFLRRRGSFSLPGLPSTTGRSITLKPYDGFIETFFVKSHPFFSNTLKVFAEVYTSLGELVYDFSPVPDEEENPPIYYDWVISGFSTVGRYTFLTKPRDEDGIVLETLYDEDGSFVSLDRIAIELPDTVEIECTLFSSGELIIIWLDGNTLHARRYSKERELLSESVVDLSFPAGSRIELRPLEHPIEGVYSVCLLSPTSPKVEVITFDFPPTGIPYFEIQDIGSVEMQIWLSTRRNLNYVISTTLDFEHFTSLPELQGDGNIINYPITFSSEDPFFIQVSESASK